MPKLTPAVLLIALSFSLGCSSSHNAVCELPTSAASAASATCTCNGACPAQFHDDIYAVSSGGLSTFPITVDTGALGSPTGGSGPTGSVGMAVVGNAFLYVANPDPEIGGNIEAWSINFNTGTLTTVPGSPFALPVFAVAAGLATADNLAAGPFLYVADSGKIEAFQVNSGTGALTALAGSPFTSGSNEYLAVDPANRFLFAADADAPGGVLAFTINASTGALTAVPGSPFALISSASVQPGQITVDPTGSFVYVAIPSTGQVAAFAIAPSSGVLTAVPGSPFTANAGASAINAVNNVSGSNFLYVSNGQASTAATVVGYSINSSTGVLSPLAGSPFAITAGEMSVGGGYLYASTAGGMMAYSINATTGALTQVGSPISFAGATAMVYSSPVAN